MNSGTPPWKKPRPQGAKQQPLSEAAKRAARARAAAAGRRYPNLIDNMWARRLMNEAPPQAPSTRKAR